MLNIIVLVALISQYCDARSYAARNEASSTSLLRGVQPVNVVTVPPNCPDGQEYVNGQCREIWIRMNPSEKSGNEASSTSLLRVVQPVNVVTVPPNCPDGQEYVNGQCREIWIRMNRSEKSGNDLLTNVRGVQPANVVTAPPNCPDGQEYVNGQCREIWRRANPDDQPEHSNPKTNLLDQIGTVLQGIALSGSSVDSAYDSAINPAVKNIVTVPNQCPDGYRPDSNGICREIWSLRDIPNMEEQVRV